MESLVTAGTVGGKKKETEHWLPYTAEKIVAIHLFKYPRSIMNAISLTTY